MATSRALTGANQYVQLLDHGRLELGKVALVVRIVVLGVAVALHLQTRAVVFALHHVKENGYCLAAQLRFGYHAHLQYGLHQLWHKLGLVLAQLEPHLAYLLGRILAYIPIPGKDYLPFIVIKVVQLQRRLHQERNRALEEIRPDLFVEHRAQEIVRDDHAELLQSAEYNRVLVHDHVHPVARKDRLLMRRHQLLEDEQNLDDKVLQLAVLVQIVDEILVMLGIHPLQYAQHYGKELANHARIPIQ